MLTKRHSPGLDSWLETFTTICGSSLISRIGDAGNCLHARHPQRTLAPCRRPIWRCMKRPQLAIDFPCPCCKTFHRRHPCTTVKCIVCLSISVHWNSAIMPLQLYVNDRTSHRAHALHSKTPVPHGAPAGVQAKVGPSGKTKWRIRSEGGALCREPNKDASRRDSCLCRSVLVGRR